MWPSGAEAHAILDCALTRWGSGVDERGLESWIAVGVYALAALLALKVVQRLPAGGSGRERAFWMLVAVVMAVFAIGKELDLPTLLTATGRCIARVQGWYDVRQGVQITAIRTAVFATLAGIGVVLWLLRRSWRRTALPLIGLGFVSCVVLVRMVGLHKVDAFMGSRVLAVPANWLFELPGPILIAVSALVLSRRLSAAD